MKSEATILRLDPNKNDKIEKEKSQLELLTIYYNELLKIDEMIPKSIKQKTKSNHEV